METRLWGQDRELAAEAHLTIQGYRFIARNVRYRVGELDLVFEKATTDEVELVFVEVRARHDGSLESALESLGPRKRLRLRRAVEQFLVYYRGMATSVRIDLLAWEGHRWLHVENIEL